jgi:membrane-associated phospholipid phosphatase
MLDECRAAYDGPLMINQPTPSIWGGRIQTLREHPALPRYLQPLFAYVVLTGLCFWAVVPSHRLWVAGHVLGEHWYSVYNGMLLVATILLFASAKIKNDAALAWRVWDLAICCAVISLGGKMIPLPRPSGGAHGFPSGHALTAFAAACLIMNTFPKAAPYAFIIAVAVGWSRVEIHEHFVYQVLAGAILGVMVGAAVSHANAYEGIILPRILRKRKTLPTLPTSS